MILLRCHNMIPAHVKWYVSETGKIFPRELFWGTRKDCEAFIAAADSPTLFPEPSQRPGNPFPTP